MNEEEKIKIALEAEWEGILVKWRNGEARKILEFVNNLVKDGWARRDAIQYVAEITRGR